MNFRWMGIIVFVLNNTEFVWAQSPEQCQTQSSLISRHIPEIPKTFMEGLGRYQNVRMAKFLDWLPNSGGMMIGTRFSDTAQVHRVPFAGGRREQLTFFPDKVAWAVACPRKNCGYFLFGMDNGGSENFQLYRQDFATSSVTLLTDGKSQNTRPLFNHAGTRAVYSSTRRNGRDYDVYVLDPENPQGEKILIQAEGMWEPLDFSPDDRTLLVKKFVSIQESHLVLVEMSTGLLTPVSPEEEREVSYPKAMFSKEGKKIYMLTDRKWEFLRLGFVETKSKNFEPKFITENLEWDVENFSLSPDGATVVFVTNENGFSTMYVQSLKGGKPRRIQNNLPGVISDLTYVPSGNLLAFTLQSNQLSGDVFSYDTKRNQVERWTYSESGGLAVERFSRAEPIKYPTFDLDGEGPRQIPAYLYLPPQKFSAPHPVIISIHGGPEGQARPVFLNQMNYWLEELGVAIIEPNVRGSLGYGKNYQTLDNGKNREDAVRDIGALLDWIGTRSDLDASRVAVYGGSYGGYMSLASLVFYSDRLRGGICYAGISNFITFLENTADYRRDLRRVEYGDEREPGMRVFLDMISPVNNVEKIRVPLLAIYGANDPRVPQSEADQIVEKLEKKGGVVWYLLAKDEGHGFVKKTNRDAAMQVMAVFLKENLLK